MLNSLNTHTRRMRARKRERGSERESGREGMREGAGVRERKEVGEREGDVSTVYKLSKGDGQHVQLGRCWD